MQFWDQSSLFFGLFCFLRIIQPLFAGLWYENLGGDQLNLCMNVPFRIKYQQITGTVASDDIWKFIPTTVCKYTPECIVPTPCSDTSFQASVIVSCPRPQIYTINYTDAAGVPKGSVKVLVNPCQDLYGWYGVPVVPSVAGAPVMVDTKWTNDDMTIRVWITSGTFSAACDESKKPVTPCAESAEVTNTFQQMGLVPYLKTYFNDQRDIFFNCLNDRPDLQRYVSGSGNGFWEFTCPRIEHNRYGVYRPNGTQQQPAGTSVLRSVPLTYQQKLQVTLSGQFSYMGYSIADSLVTFSRPKFDFTQLTPTMPRTVLTHTGYRVTTIIFEPCNTNTAVILYQDATLKRVLYTDDEFATVSDLNIRLGTYDSATLTEVVLTQSYMYFLTAVPEGKLFALRRNETSGVATEILTAKTTTLIGMWGSDWCAYGSSSRVSRDCVIAWNTSTIFLGTSPRNFLAYNIPVKALANETKIDASIIPLPTKFAVIVLFNQYLYTLSVPWILFNPSLRTSFKPWAASDILKGEENPWKLWTTLPGNDPLRVYTLFTGKPSVLVTYDTFSVIVSDDQKNMTNNNKQIFSPVEQWQAGESGHVFVVTAEPFAYFGIAGSTDLLGFRAELVGLASLWIDRFDRLVILTFTPSSALGIGKVTKHVLDINTENLNLQKKPEDRSACPFISFSVEDEQKWYQIDGMRTHSIAGVLWYETSGGNTNDLEVRADTQYAMRDIQDDREKRLNSSIINQKRTFGNLVQVTSTLIFSNPLVLPSREIVHDIRFPKDTEGHVTTVSFRPKNVNEFCTQSTQSIFWAEGSCPIGLSIRLIPQFPCPNGEYAKSFTVPGKYRFPKTEIGVTVEEGLPCESPYYGSPYRPQLGLYYFDQFVELVIVDFFVFETAWRTDFTYNTTEIQAGCTRSAQTNIGMMQMQGFNFNDVIRNYNDTPVDVEGNLLPVWGPLSYRSCFVAPPNYLERAPSNKRIYEVLNGKQGNSIVFPDYPGTYVLVAQVLSNTYSFCNLKVKFVVQPYGHGDMPDPWGPVYMFIVSCFACALFFWTCFSIYALSWNENRVGFDMLGKEEVPSAWHLITKGEHKLLQTGSEDGDSMFVPTEVLQKKSGAGVSKPKDL